MTQDISAVGIDIAKRVLHVIGMDSRGKIILHKCLQRGEIVSFMAKLSWATVGMAGSLPLG
jgi:transposase